MVGLSEEDDSQFVIPNLIWDPGQGRSGRKLICDRMRSGSFFCDQTKAVMLSKTMLAWVPVQAWDDNSG